MTLAEEFEAFWAVYPRHIAKLAAQKAFMKARKAATFADLVDGVRRYIQGKPSYADWAHASTWLNAGRWLDEYETAPIHKRHWTEECQELHGGTCLNHWNHGMRMLETRQDVKMRQAGKDE